MVERWVLSADGTSATVSGRERVSLWWKLNPLWWFGNAVEQKVDEAPWYMPTSPEWLRALAWGIRNPLQNFRAFVIGVQDCNYTVTGKARVMTVQRDDIGETGWQWCVVHTRIPRPFVSYSGKHVTWYIGTQPTGFSGIKFNIH